MYSGTIDPSTGHKSGYGIEARADGSQYEGFWERDLAEGYGRFTSPNGDMYIGDWVANQAHGHGEY